MSSPIKNIEGLTKELAVLGKDPAMSLIILFGSVARMETHRESDVDVAFLSDEPLDLLELTMKVTRLLRTDHVDVVDLRRASPLLAMEVIRGGRIVYERAPGEYATFGSLAFRRYVDTAKLRVAQKQAIGNFLAFTGTGMTSIDPSVLRRKLAAITANLQALEPVAAMPLERYRADVFTRKGTERLLQELIEAAIDLNTHLITQEGCPAPDDYFHSFLLLGDQGILTPDLAKALAPAAGVRNRLVHEYDAIVDALVLDAVRKAQDLFPRYVAAVERHLEGTDRGR